MGKYTIFPKLGGSWNFHSRLPCKPGLPCPSFGGTYVVSFQEVGREVSGLRGNEMDKGCSLLRKAGDLQRPSLETPGI